MKERFKRVFWLCIEEKMYIIFLNGPLAQLVARFHGMEEVAGSNPARSTQETLKKASIAQWIELSRPKGEMGVRFPLGAQKEIIFYESNMSGMRIIKVNELLRKLLGEIMERELSLKKGVFITIAKIDTSRDLRYTRMFVSVFPEQESHYITETLKKELPKIQKELYSKLHMKPMPKLSFEIDTTAQEADVVEKLLKEIF